MHHWMYPWVHCKLTKPYTWRLLSISTCFLIFIKLHCSTVCTSVYSLFSHFSECIKWFVRVIVYTLNIINRHLLLKISWHRYCVSASLISIFFETPTIKCRGLKCLEHILSQFPTFIPRLYTAVPVVWSAVYSMMIGAIYFMENDGYNDSAVQFSMILDHIRVDIRECVMCRAVQKNSGEMIIKTRPHLLPVWQNVCGSKLIIVVYHY